MGELNPWKATKELEVPIKRSHWVYGTSILDDHRFYDFHGRTY